MTRTEKDEIFPLEGHVWNVSWLTLNIAHSSPPVRVNQAYPEHPSEGKKIEF